MRTETFKVGCDGDIDDSVVFATAGEAIAHAKRVWEKEQFEEHVAVYGYADYSEDDTTLSYAMTTFWRHWYITLYGKISYDGR